MNEYSKPELLAEKIQKSQFRKLSEIPDKKTVKERQNTDGVQSKYISELVGKQKCVKVADLLQMLKKQRLAFVEEIKRIIDHYCRGNNRCEVLDGLVNENIVEMCRNIDFSDNILGIDMHSPKTSEKSFTITRKNL